MATNIKGNKKLGPQQYFIPVDYETYANWTQQLNQGMETATRELYILSSHFNEKG